MKNSKLALTIIIVLTFSLVSSELFGQDRTFSYAYISIKGKLFSKKIKVIVDFGDTPEQIKTGEEYSEILSNKRSYAAILNYMVENQFELVETLTLVDNSSFQGTGDGGTSGIIFIMRKEE